MGIDPHIRLNMIRQELDRMAAQRLLAPLDRDQKKRYFQLAAEEEELLRQLARTEASIRGPQRTFDSR